MNIKKVSFFGYSHSEETDEEFIGAYESAKLVAKSGRTVVNGGGPGVMYAASKGAKDAGGRVEVVYYQPKNATNFEGKSGIQLADEESVEENYIDRTQRLIEKGDAYVVFNGGTGTVSEFAMTWAVARLYIGHHKPLIFYGDFWKNILDAFWKNMKVREEAYRTFKYATAPHHVIEHLESFEKMFDEYQAKNPEDRAGDDCELFLHGSNSNHIED